MRLLAIYFMPGIQVALSGRLRALDHGWTRGVDRDNKLLAEPKNSEGVACEERSDGDVWITEPGGRRHTLHPWAIRERVHEPDPPQQGKAKQ